MANYAEENLISLSDKDVLSPPLIDTTMKSQYAASSAGNHSTTLPTTNTFAEKPKPIISDSFSELANLMRRTKTPFSVSSAPFAKKTVETRSKTFVNDIPSSISEAQNHTPFLSVDDYLRGYEPKLEHPKPQAKRSALIQGPALASNEFKAAHKPNNDTNGYNEEKMRVLENMLAQMDLESDDEQGNEAEVPKQHESLAPRCESLEPPASYPVHKAYLQMDESIVRLTLPVYNSMLQERDKYKAHAERLQEEAAKRLKENLTKSEGSLESIANRLILNRNMSNLVPKSGMHATLQQKDQASGQVKTTLVGRLRLEAKTQQPQQGLDNTFTSETTGLTQSEYKMAKAIENEDPEIVELQQWLRATEQQKDEVIKSLTAECDRLLHDHRRVGDHEKNRQELVDTIALKENKIEELISELEATKTQQVHLFTQLQENNTLHDDLQNKAKQVDTLKNDLSMALKKISDSEAVVNRLSSDKESLKNATHLVEPPARTKLPKTVLGCFGCYVMNMACDRNSPCQNCRDNDERCRRWKCALKHVTKACPYYPMCYPKHCEEGWLVSSWERPTW